MEQLNKKRDDLKNQQKVLNSKIATREEKQSYLVNRKNELEARKNELNCKQSSHYALTFEIWSFVLCVETEKI